MSLWLKQLLLKLQAAAAGPSSTAPLAWAAGKAAITLVLIWVGFSPRPAAATDSQTFAAASAQFLRATGGVDDAIEPAAAKFQQLSRAEPADPVLRAYSGAATAMRARTAVLPWHKLSHAEDGLAQIDKALAQLTAAHDAPLYRGVPASLEARFVAASCFLALPTLFNRGPRGTQLLQAVLNSPLFDASPVAFRAAVWLRAGTEAADAHRNDEARAWLKKAAASAAPQAAAAQARLKEL